MSTSRGEIASPADQSSVQQWSASSLSRVASRGIGHAKWVLMHTEYTDAMSSTASNRSIEYHVLNFFYDNEDNCALTALINNVRFHVIAETSKVRHGRVGQEYAKLLQVVKEGSLEDDLPSSDSGVDVRDGSEEAEELLAAKGEDAEEALQRWMLSPLQSNIDEYAPKQSESAHISLAEWFDLPTHWYNLETKDKALHAIELEPDDDLHRRISKLLPEISIPKYIREVDVPFYQPSDLIVSACSNVPPPYRPTRVQLPDTKDILFLKLVDPGQPQCTKREISILDRIAKKGLHDHIRCPRLKGIVTSGDDRTKIMGFLQTDIPNPVPLTTKLDVEVPQKLRDHWAHETPRMKDVLHEHGIVWGDAKADNFMVDENDELWIIDFGGSYTEGWVDPKLNESMEGDDMGVDKIVNALHDPVANTWDPDTEKSFGGSPEIHAEDRKRKAEDEDEVENEPAVKKQKKSSAEQQKAYCYCDGPSSGRMIACDGADCEREWFHFDCVGMSELPGDDQEWLCKDCEVAE
ncbi:hypothetical protein LTR17_004401 [Elasticomyces elasticus]|nr:hypothetical protein LTR17_004401 [Elasticomyces elasticus]